MTNGIVIFTPGTRRGFANENSEIIPDWGVTGGYFGNFTGASGVPNPYGKLLGGEGGDGGSSATGLGGWGGNGSSPGGGGGGGGMCVSLKSDTSASAKGGQGGNGAPGIVIVITHF